MNATAGLKTHPHGCCLAVLCQPGSKRNSIGSWHDRHLRIQLLAAAVEGKANEGLQQLLAESFGIKRRDVQLLSGEHSRKKRVLLRGLSLDEVSDKIAMIHDATQQA